MENLVSQNPLAFDVARRRMIDEQLKARHITDPRVVEVMSKIPRHFFVDPALADQAYGDFPIGIGEGQTISQPYIVALMTQSLELTGNEKVLEIGTGSGYQTAILASLARQIHTIERIKPLALRARRILKQLGLKNVILRVGDGTRGWPDAAPFDVILVAAASPEVPQPLFDQLPEGGRLVVPIGSVERQILLRISRQNGRRVVEELGECRFVKLVGRFGWGAASLTPPRSARKYLG